MDINQSELLQYISQNHSQKIDTYQNYTTEQNRKDPFFKYEKIIRSSNSLLKQIINNFEITINRKNINQRKDGNNQNFTQYEQIIQDSNHDNNEQPFLNQQQHETTICEKKGSKLWFLYQPDTSEFIKVKKFNYNDKDTQNGKMIIKKLQGQNITIENINHIEKDENTKYIEQIAGKLDLFDLKQIRLKNHIFEVYFLILLQKLERMHELGVAHGDIKPQNIVISYDNEPYFIDFDNSVLLSDYHDYLKSLTINYNLEKYIKIVQFEIQEEVKLCDRTQLALTFLYLFCENENEDKLFKKKDFKKLLDQKLNKKPKELNQRSIIKYQNKQIIFSLINSILNEADKNIELYQTQIQKQNFIIDFYGLQTNLSKTNSIILYKDTYEVQRIDKNSAQLINLVDKFGKRFKLQFLKSMQIIPFPGIKELLQKYKIELNFRKSDHRYFNLSKIVNCGYDVIQKIDLEFSNNESDQQLYEILQNSKNINRFDFKFFVKKEQFQEFLTQIKQNLHDFYISTVEYQQDNLYFLICTIKRKELKDIDFELNLNFRFDQNFLMMNEESIFNLLEEYSNQNDKINLTFCLDIDIISFQRTEEKIDDQIKKFQLWFENINKKIQLFFQKHKILLNILRLNYNIISQKPISLFEKINYNRKLNYFFKYIQLYTSTKNINEDIQKQELLKSYYELLKKTNIQCFYGEMAFILSLSFFQFDQQFKQINIRFQDHFFIEKQMWEELRTQLKDKPYKFMKIILINCKFSKDVLEILKDINQTNKEVKFKYYEDYDQIEYDKQYSKVFKKIDQYQLNIDFCNESSSLQELEIQFFKSFADGIQYEKQYDINEDKQSQNNEVNKIANKNDQNKEEQSTKIIKNFFEPELIYKYSYFSNIQIPKNLPQYIESIKIINIRVYIYVQEEIDLLIQLIKKNAVLQLISISIPPYRLSLCNNSLRISFTGKNIHKDQLNQLEYVYLTQINRDNNMKQQSKKIEISQHKNAFKYFSIYENFFKIEDQIHKIEEMNFHKDSIFKIACSVFRDVNYFSGFQKIFKLQFEFKKIYKSPSTKLTIKDILQELNDYLVNYSLSSFNIFQLVLKDFELQDEYVMIFHLNYQVLEDIPLKILLQEIENFFKHKKKWYKIEDCLNTNEKLHVIYEIIKGYENQQTMQFDFYLNDLTYLQFKQFIKQIIIDNNSHQEFSFEINSFSSEIIQFIESEFQCYQLPQEQNKQQTHSQFLFGMYFNTKNMNSKHSAILQNCQSSDFSITEKTYIINLANLDKNKIQCFIQMLDSPCKVGFTAISEKCQKNYEYIFMMSRQFNDEQKQITKCSLEQNLEGKILLCTNDNKSYEQEKIDEQNTKISLEEFNNFINEQFNQNFYDSSIIQKCIDSDN